MDKRHVLAISKSDMLDEELMHEISYDLPEIPYVFISSITGFGIPTLKDVLWRELNSDMVVPMTVTREALVHRNLDLSKLGFEEDETIRDDESSVDDELWDGDDEPYDVDE